MSRTLVNPKTGRLLSSVPDNGSDCILIGRICFHRGAPYHNPAPNVNLKDERPDTWVVMPYVATRLECQQMAQALLDVTDAELLDQYENAKHMFGEGYSVDQFRSWCTRMSSVLKRLKYGYCDCGDERYMNLQRLIHKIMPRALQWIVTDTEEKFRDWLERPNPDFVGNFAPIDLLHKSLEPGLKSCFNIVASHIENRVMGIPT